MTPAPTADRPQEAPLARLAAWVRRRLVWLLVACYGLAACAPEAGLALHRLGATDDAGAIAPFRFSLVLVGVLLFCGAVSVDLPKLRELAQRPGQLAVALGLVWAPALLVIAAWNALAAGWLPSEQVTALALGLALAGAMPVANSAVAWTHQSGGSLVWALGLVVLSICLCPWVTPGVMRVMGLTLSPGDAAQAAQLVSRFTGAVFVCWVLGPTLLGFSTRAALGGDRIERGRTLLTLLSAAALLLLNYANAAKALPSLFKEPDWPLLVTTCLAAAALPIAGVTAAWGASRTLGIARPTRLAWAYALGMKNTGLALGLAGATLGDQPVAVLVILAVTLTQHLVAGVVHAVASRRAKSG